MVNKKITAKPLKLDNALKELSKQINETYQQTAQGFIAMGKLLYEANRLLEKGDNIHRNEFEELLPFTWMTARKLIQISRYAPFKKQSVLKRLPPAWGTLYEISTLNENEFDKALSADVTIRPGGGYPLKTVPLIRADMDRKEIESWKKYKGKKPVAKKLSDDYYNLCVIKISKNASEELFNEVFSQINGIRNEYLKHIKVDDNLSTIGKFKTPKSKVKRK
jgi:hypothetical protein